MRNIIMKHFWKNMENFYDQMMLLLDGIETKISFAAFAAYVSYNLGGSEWLLLVVQYIFIADFVLGVLDASKANKFSWARSGRGIKKIISLYFGVLVVGFGTKAFDIAIHGRMQIDYNGAFLFDLFIYLLILFELASINKHLAHLDFSVNKFLESFFDRIIKKITTKLNKALDSSVDKTTFKDK